MKKILLLSLIFIFLFSILPISNIEAKSGCCSHHGGVCGCSCCDGTPLSAKCAPYYPQCSASIPTPIPVVPSVYKHQENQKVVPDVEEKTGSEGIGDLKTNQFAAEVPKPKERMSLWWWIVIIGGLLR